MNQSRRPVVIPTLAALAVAACLLPAQPAFAASTNGCFSTRSFSDFNGDGYDDAAVGDPYASVDGVAGAGAVTVLLGGPDGRIGEGSRQVITQASFGDTPEAGDHFGYDVFLARTSHSSGCADLLIGAPGEDLSGGADAGVAYLVSDLPDAEGTPAMDVVALTQAGAKGAVEAGDRFGSTVAITNPVDDSHLLVIGAPGENAGSIVDAGAVNLWRLDEGPVGVGELRQGKLAPWGSLRLPGAPQPGDRFGSTLAVGTGLRNQESGPELADAGSIAIGAPGDTVSGHDEAGSVTVVQDRFQTVKLLTQDSTGVPGIAETGDQFGAGLALSPEVDDQPGSLAVGSPGEDAGQTRDTGSVTLFSMLKEQIGPRTAFSQATYGVPGVNESGDRFGSSLSFGQLPTTLLIGSPTEDVGSVADAGAVQPVRVPGPQKPIVFLPAITENAAGTAGSVGTGHQFGRSVAARSGQSENILTMSSLAGGGYAYVLSDNATIPPRSWVAAAGAKRFGWAVTN